MKFIQVQWTTDNKEIAHQVAKHLIQNQLAACIHISPQGESTYLWNNEVAYQNEYKVFIKTKRALFTQVAKVINTYSNYEVSEIIAFDMSQIDEKYHQWLISSLPPVKNTHS